MGRLTEDNQFWEFQILQHGDRSSTGFNKGCNVAIENHLSDLLLEY